METKHVTEIQWILTNLFYYEPATCVKILFIVAVCLCLFF